jgi:hypothetical protein
MMTEEEALAKLESLLGDLGIEVRYESGDFSGGLYRYNTKHQIILNKDLNLKQKITIIIEELKNHVDLDNLYIVPVLREVIENANCLE